MKVDELSESGSKRIVSTKTWCKVFCACGENGEAWLRISFVFFVPAERHANAGDFRCNFVVRFPRGIFVVFFVFPVDFGLFFFASCSVDSVPLSIFFAFGFCARSDSIFFFHHAGDVISVRCVEIRARSIQFFFMCRAASF